MKRKICKKVVSALSITLIISVFLNLFSYRTEMTTIYKEDKFAYNSYVALESYIIRVNKNIYVGETKQIDVTYNPANATIKDTYYSTSNSRIATVSSNGVITGISPGVCYITVTVKNAGSGKVKINVLNNENVSYEDEEEITDEDNSTYTDEDIDYDYTEDYSDYSEDDTKTTSNNNISKKKKTIKDGWYRKNGKRYYYRNGKPVKNSYVDYIYLNKNGVAQKKMGVFSVTLYGATAWANQSLSMRSKATKNSSHIGTVPTGGKMKIISSMNSNTKYIKVSYKGKKGYVYSNNIYINLPDVMPDAVYEISNASGSIYKSSGKNIPGITGKNLYGQTKKYNKKIGKKAYYVPLLFPVAKQLQKAYDKARSEGYNLKIYDTYRPYSVSKRVNSSFRSLYNSNKKVRNKVNYDKNGNYWGPTWFLANNVSRHNRGTALDLTLTNSNNKELKAQTPMHTLDTRSLRKYNNKTAKKLSRIMTSVGFETLESEWWHFQEDNYKNSPYTTFKVK